MIKRLVVLLPLLLLTASITVAETQELLTRPVIEGYPTPENQFPGPRATGMEYSDVLVLVVVLGLASYFSLLRRSRRSLLVLTAFSLVWFGFLREGCVCSIGSIQNVALALGDPTYGISLAVVAFFAIPLGFTLFFGRTFCSSVCPLGAVQELVALQPVKVPSWIDHTLGLVPYFYLGAAVVFAATGTAFIIC